MKNTRLSDFTEEQLNLIAKTMIWKQLDIKEQIINYQKYPELLGMFAEDILRWKAEVEELNTIIIQFAHAAHEKTQERIALSN